MNFLNTIIGIVADKITDKVIERLDAYYNRLNKFNTIKKEMDKDALEVKEMISKAQTDEERDVLLDKLDELLRRDIKFN